MQGNQPTPSPRAARHMKTSHSGLNVPINDGSGGLPASHGRRLMQMIFRSNNECEPKQRVREAMVLTSPVAIHSDSRSEDDDVPVGSNKLSALKRKLFPSRKRRHPVRIPPLVVSPIHANAGDNNHADDQEVLEIPSEVLVAADENAIQVDGERFACEGDDHDFDDDLLEAIEEADRLQSTTSDETLAELSRAIDDLYQWKAQQELAMQSALKTMDEQAEQEVATSNATVHDEACEAALLEDAEHNQHAAEAARVKLMLTLKETKASMAARRNDTDQVAQVLLKAKREAANMVAHESDATAAITLSKLRDEVFELGVKELSAKLQASWLQELGGVDDDLDMELFDVQAFASDLDNVLAQFDAVGNHHEQSTAGQMAQEH